MDILLKYCTKYDELANATKDWHEQIPGGLAHGKLPVDFDNEQLAKGLKIEMEHTNDPHKALEIAMDHLVENDHYYDALLEMERTNDPNKALEIAMVSPVLSLKSYNDISVERLLKVAQNIEIRRKLDTSNNEPSNLRVESEILIDLKSSMNGCLSTLQNKLPIIEKLIKDKSKNDLVSVPQEVLEIIRNFSGHLSLLCNMILNGKEYTEDEKLKAVNDLTY